MKKILILGGSHRDIPLIKAAQELGYFVATLGNRDYYLGHSYANYFYQINFNETSKVKEVIEQDNFDFIVPGSGEEPYLQTVKIANELNIGNFDTLETANLIHNKWKFKEFCIQNKISVPKGYFYTEHKNIDELSFPLVIKPTNLSGGRGIKIVNNEKEFHTHIDGLKNISTKDIFLEEYIEGELIAYSVFIENKKITYDFIAKDDVYLNKYLITTAFPFSIKEEIHTRLQGKIEKLSSILNLVNGMFHLQILIKNNIPYIIDVTRRIPGDFFPDLIESCDNVSYSKAVVQSYTTNTIDNWMEYKEKKQNFFIRHCIMPSKNGIYQDIIINDTIKPYIISSFSLEKKGLKIENYLHTQLAIIFIKLPTINNDIIRNLNSLIYAHVI